MDSCGESRRQALEARGLGLVKRQRIKETLKRERLKGGHFGVRRIVEKKIERMPRHSLLALPLVFINVKRQSGDRLRQDADAGINRCGLLAVNSLTFFPAADLPKTKGQPLKW